jgi:protein TonB
MRFVLRLGERERVGRYLPDGIPSYPAPELLVRWSSRAAEFPGNLAALLARAPVTAAMLRGFSVPLPAGVMRPASLGASLLAHALLLSLLAAISFVFGQRPPTAAELAVEHQRRITWYYFSDELPAIAPLEAPADAKPQERKRAERANPAPSRQSIISIPAKADNLSQTILQPAAPDIRITRHVPLPNIVMWPSQPARPVLEYLPPPELAMAQTPPRLPALPVQKPSLEYLPAPDVRVGHVPLVPAPQAERPVLEYLPPPRAVVQQAPRLPAPAVETPLLAYLPAPEVRLSQPVRVPAPAVQRPSLEYLPPPDVRMSQAPRAPVPPVQAAAVEQAYLAAPPQIAARALADNRLIAVGLDPATPAPQIAVPLGNRAGRFSTAGEPASGNGSEGRAEASASSLPPPGSTLRVPGLSITGGVRPPAADAGPVVSGPRPPANPATPLAAPPAAAAPRTVDPNALANAIARATRPQLGLPEIGRGRQPIEREVLSGKKVYTVYINMPNLSSGAGSWVLRFAELGERPVGEDAELTAPVARRKVDPGYDPDAVRERLEGVVVLYAIIRHDGTVGSVKVVRGLDPRLDENAVRALERWQFHPARRNGMPVDLEAVVHIPFSLPGTVRKFK